MRHCRASGGAEAPTINNGDNGECGQRVPHRFFGAPLVGSVALSEPARLTGFLFVYALIKKALAPRLPAACCTSVLLSPNVSDSCQRRATAETRPFSLVKEGFSASF